MRAEPNANAAAPYPPLRYRWESGTDRLVWHLVPKEWRDVLPGAGPGRNGDLNDLIVETDRAERKRALAQLPSSDTPLFVRYRIQCAAGPVWVRERLAAGERPETVEGELVRLSDGEAQLAELRGGLSYDPLTGAFTRQRLVQGLELAVAKALADGSSGAFLVVDVDNFALLNHALGCAAGDAVLVGLAERLHNSIGNGSLLGRVGDDSFGIVLEGASEDSALALSEQLVRSIGETPIQVDGEMIVTVSVGAVVFPALACSAAEAMARADLAVAGAKASGRNHFELYALSENQRIGQRRDLAIARRVQDALAERRLVFAYQPVVNAKSHTPAFYECLLRMRTPNNTVVPAGQFVPVIEELGLMRQIDHFVLEAALNELRHEPLVSLAINVSGYTTSDAAWLKRLQTLCAGDPSIARRLIVEITETAAMRNLDDASRFASAVREAGARIALDDFGAGYSSFRHLKSLDVDIVKIDGLFTGRLAEQPDNLLFFKALLGLAKGCGFETVAECAETAQDAMLLAASGVTYIQGYYFAKPELTRLNGSPVLPLHAASNAAPDRNDDAIGGLRFVS